MVVPKFHSNRRAGSGMYNIKVSLPREKLEPRIPYCRMSMYPKLCQKYWIETVATPWMRENVKDPELVNMTATSYLEHMPADLYTYDETGASWYEAQDGIYKYMFPFFLFLGTVGSIACLILLNKYSHMVWSTCFYLSLLMGVDLLILYAHCGNDWYSRVTETNLSGKIILLSNSICKVYSFLLNFLDHFSSWITVCISIDLMIAIRFPHHMYRMCTRERAQAVMLLIVVLLVCLNLHYFWTLGLTIANQDPDIQETLCHENYNEVPQEFHDLWSYVQLFITHIFPLIVVMTSVLVAMTVIFKQSRPNEDTETLLSKYFLDLNTLKQIKLATGFMCLLYLPLAFLRSIVDILQMLGSKQYADISYEHFVIAEISVTTMKYAYISLKPYIFIIISSKLRRDIFKGLKRLYKCRILRSKNKQYRVSNTESKPSSTMDNTNTKTFAGQGARPKTYSAPRSAAGTITDV